MDENVCRKQLSRVRGRQDATLQIQLCHGREGFPMSSADSFETPFTVRFPFSWSFYTSFLGSSPHHWLNYCSCQRRVISVLSQSTWGMKRLDLKEGRSTPSSLQRLDKKHVWLIHYNFLLSSRLLGGHSQVSFLFYTCNLSLRLFLIQPLQKQLISNSVSVVLYWWVMKFSLGLSIFKFSLFSFELRELKRMNRRWVMLHVW